MRFDTLVGAVVRKLLDLLHAVIHSSFQLEHSVCALIRKMQGWRWNAAGAGAESRKAALAPAAAPKATYFFSCICVCARPTSPCPFSTSICWHIEVCR